MDTTPPPKIAKRDLRNYTLPTIIKQFIITMIPIDELIHLESERVSQVLFFMQRKAMVMIWQIILKP